MATRVALNERRYVGSAKLRTIQSIAPIGSTPTINLSGSRISEKLMIALLCVRSGENALLRTIYSLAIGCHSKLVKMGDSELAQGSLPFNKYYRLINAMFSGEDTSTDRVARS